MGTQLPRAPKGAHQPPTFRYMSVVAKRSSISVTAELFFLNDSLMLSSLVGNIHYTTCRRSSNEGFWEKNGILKVVISLYNVWLGHVRAYEHWRLKELLKRLQLRL